VIPVRLAALAVNTTPLTAFHAGLRLVEIFSSPTIVTLVSLHAQMDSMEILLIIYANNASTTAYLDLASLLVQPTPTLFLSMDKLYAINAMLALLEALVLDLKLLRFKPQ